MPIYGYICRNCEHAVDVLQKISDEPLVDCPACGEPALKRQLSAPRFRLKGQGWYETDFKKDKQRNLAGEKDGGTDKKTDEKKTEDKKGGDKETTSAPKADDKKGGDKKATPKAGTA